MKGKIFNNKALEKINSGISKLLENQELDSKEALQEFLNEKLKNEKIDFSSGRTKQEIAQDLMYDAWDTEKRKTRVELAQKALNIFPDCADAYNLLAEDEAKTLEEAKTLYQKGMESGRKTLGKKFKEMESYFWGINNTRPYMRSCFGLMKCYWASKEYEKAIDLAKKMLKLNPNDNQGVRYLLIIYLAEVGKYAELKEFMESQYKDESSTEWTYIKALLFFALEGVSKKAEKLLNQALKDNCYVPEYLTEQKPLPHLLPDCYRWGSPEEAVLFVANSLNVWKKIPGALDWLKSKYTGQSSSA